MGLASCQREVRCIFLSHAVLADWQSLAASAQAWQYAAHLDTSPPRVWATGRNYEIIEKATLVGLLSIEITGAIYQQRKKRDGKNLDHRLIPPAEAHRIYRHLPFWAPRVFPVGRIRLVDCAEEHQATFGSQPVPRSQLFGTVAALTIGT